MCENIRRAFFDAYTISMEGNDISVSVGDKIQEFYFYQSFLNSDAVYAICALNNNTNKIIYCKMESFLKEVQKVVLPL